MPTPAIPRRHPLILRLLGALLALALAGTGAMVVEAPVAHGQHRGARNIKKTLRPGQTVNELLKKAGVDGGQIIAATRALKPKLDLARKARPGDTVQATINGRGELIELIYISKRHGAFRVQRKGQKMVASRWDGERTVDDAIFEPAGPPPPAPSWMVPHAADTQALRLKAYFERSGEAARQQEAQALEAELGIDGVRALVARAFTPPARKPGVHTDRATLPSGLQIEYVVYVPDDYDPARPLPLHINLHGKGGSGPHACRAGWEHPYDGLLLACPSSPGGLWYADHGSAVVTGAWRQIMRDYAVLGEQVVLGGFSNGGNGTWQLGARWPWRWAALVPRSGSMLGREKWRQNVLHLPVFMTHGTEDHNIGVNHARRMVEFLAEVGNTARYVEMQGEGHDFFSHLNPEIAAWMKQQRRKPRPSFLFNQTEFDGPERVYWVLADRAGTIEAAIAPEGDHTLVTLTTQFPARRLEVHLVDGLADVSRPVKVVLNGEVAFEGMVQPSARALLDSFEATGELARATPYIVRLAPAP